MNTDLDIAGSTGPTEDPQTHACREIARRFAAGEDLTREDWLELSAYALLEAHSIESTSYAFDF